MTAYRDLRSSDAERVLDAFTMDAAGMSRQGDALLEACDLGIRERRVGGGGEGRHDDVQRIENRLRLAVRHALVAAERRHGGADLVEALAHERRPHGGARAPRRVRGGPDR